MVQYQYPGQSWHAFVGLVWLRGSDASADDLIDGKQFMIVLIVSDSTAKVGGCSMQPEIDSIRSTIAPPRTSSPERRCWI